MNYLAEIRALYWGADAESARLRAALLGAVRRLTPYAMASNIGSASLVLWSYRSAPPAGMLLWWLLVVAVGALAWAVWWRQRGRRPDRASPRALRQVTGHTLVLAGLWAVMPVLWFPGAEAAQQLLVATLITGMLGAGGYVLSPLPLASLAWVGLFSLSAVAALGRQGDAEHIGIFGLLVLYAGTVAVGSLSAGRRHAKALRDQARSVRQERMLALLLQDFEQHADEALWQTGPDGRLTHHSPRLAHLLGMDVAALEGRPLMALLQHRVHTGLDALQHALDTGRPFRDLALALDTGTAQRHLSLHGKRLVDEQGRTLGWRGVVSDITDRVAAQQQLQQLAHTDSLTGLANRHTLRHALATAVQQARPLALLALDLDHFKSVNDTLGHTAGDEVLRSVALRLREGTRPGDLVARLGGDEFMVLLPAPPPADELAALAQRLVDSLGQPIAVGERRLQVGASVGIARCDGSPVTVDDLLAQADLALYAAKEGGRGRHAVYSASMGERNRRLAALEQGLRGALGRGELLLHWQPQVDIARWKVVGAEALLRWRHPLLGLVSPAEFIPVAEQCGLIDAIGQWALKQACQAGVEALPGLGVSVNVSPVQLRDPQFPQRLAEHLLASGLAPARLTLEITESIFMDDIDGMLARLTAIRALGVKVALDDFGTGYSSLAYLRRFPFDTLKIDRAFINEVLVRDDTRAIVRTIAQMAATLGMRTVCEGVELAQQLAAVQQAGCDEVQGYLVSPPVPLDALVALRANWSRPVPALASLAGR